MEVFVSSRSISKGANGVDVIEENLDASGFGIVLVSRANQAAPWLNYEAGWLASALDRPVATICLDLRPSDITTPLAPKQATQFEDDGDMKRLLREIVTLANADMSDRAFNALLADVWPTIRDSWVSEPDSALEVPARSESDMLAEVVERVRRIEEGIEANGQRAALSSPKGKRLADRLNVGQPPSFGFFRAVEEIVLRTTSGRAGLVECSLDESEARVTIAVDEEVAARRIRSTRQEIEALVPEVSLMFRAYRRVRPGDVHTVESDERTGVDAIDGDLTSPSKN
jgi:hypothetical protein